MAVVHRHLDTPTSDGRRAATVWLDDERALDADVVGAKAANLAIARRARLPVLEGFVATVSGTATDPRSPAPDVRTPWHELSAGGTIPLVVRSSSPAEDLARGSMAGVFDSVVDVRGWEAFVAAYERVVASAPDAPMAVLVQRLVVPDTGGVLFGVDPITGEPGRMVIAAVTGGPHRLVSGEVQGRRTVVRASGRVVEADGDDAPVLSLRHRRLLVRLARELAGVFGGPQDVEWALLDGRPILLQSRPVTTDASPPVGPVLGPGPVAETLPDPLSPLEVDLWIPPLRAAMAETLAVTGSASRRRIARSPVVAVVDHQAAVDLELVGDVRPGNRVLRAVDPRPGVRRLGAAWRMGRLRGAFGDLAARVTADVDRELAALPALDVLADDELLRLLHNAAAYLRALHAHEMLAAVLTGSDGGSAAGAALQEIARGRARGWSDDDIVARAPVALAVLAPSTGDRPPLPAVDGLPPAATDEPLATREELRLRARWVHELTAQVVRELGARLVARGTLAEADRVRQLRLAALPDALAGRPFEAATQGDEPSAPLPARFRLSVAGTVVAERSSGTSPGTGAAGGRARGPVASGPPALGDVLVVRNLDPALAVHLPRVAAIVAETGSPLSHLAILAREQGVPVVVGFAGAIDRFPAGTAVVVDGTAGTVDLAVASEVVAG